MREESEKIRVLLADGQPLYSVGVAQTLKNAGYLIAGIVKDAGLIVQEFKKHNPDFLICDATFGIELSGLLAAKNILSENEHAQIIFLSSCLDADAIKKAYEIGGKAYLSKSIDSMDFLTALTAIWEKPHDIFFSSDIARLVASHEFAQAKTKAQSPRTVLSERELDIFRLVANGKTQPEVAQELGLHPRTIAGDVAQIKDKLGVSRPALLTIMAVRHGLIKVSNSP